MNPTLEYTAPYGLFGDQEIVLITLPGRDDEFGLWINLDCEGLGYRRAPTSIRFFLAVDFSIQERIKDLRLSCKSELDQRGLI
jgi:hypothetical protein